MKNKKQLHADRYLRWVCLNSTKRRYGDNDFYMERLETELKQIAELNLSNHFLVLKEMANLSRRKGYPVIIKGKVEHLLVAYLLRISAVNPLRPHYHCNYCHYHRFRDEEENGFDLPEQECPICNMGRRPDGHDLCEDFLWNFPPFHMEVAPSVRDLLESRIYVKEKELGTEYPQPICLEDSILCEMIGRMQKETGIRYGNVNPRDRLAGIYVYDEEHQRIFGDIDVDLEKYSFRELVRVGQMDKNQTIGILIYKVTLEWYKQHYPNVYIKVMKEMEDVARV